MCLQVLCHSVKVSGGCHKRGLAAACRRLFCAARSIQIQSSRPWAVTACAIAPLPPTPEHTPSLASPSYRCFEGSHQWKFRAVDCTVSDQNGNSAACFLQTVLADIGPNSIGARRIDVKSARSDVGCRPDRTIWSGMYHPEALESGISAPDHSSPASSLPHRLAPATD